MRIAYLHYLVPDDTGRHHVRQFAAGARALGHEVEVVAMNLAAEGGQAPGSRVRRRSRLRDWAVRRAGRYLHEPKELLWNAFYVPRELAILRRLRPDVLLVRDHALTASCVTVARRLCLPLVLELNAALVQEAFPPKTDQIDFVRPKGAGPYYEWRTRSGWLVRCRDDDAVTIEWVGEKGL